MSTYPLPQSRQRLVFRSERGLCPRLLRGGASGGSSQTPPKIYQWRVSPGLRTQIASGSTCRRATSAASRCGGSS
jgi:hypothetical protein